MITASLGLIEKQAHKTPALQKAIEFLLRPDIASLPDGRIEIDGDSVFALVQRYETIKTPEPQFEYHRKYIDIQYIVSGEEIIGFSPLERMTVTDPYAPDKDICFGRVEPGQWTPLYLTVGQAAILYPTDAHAPKMAANNPVNVLKIVVKVAV